MPTLGEIEREVRRLSRGVARAIRLRPRRARPFGWRWERRFLPHYVPDTRSRFHRRLLRDLSRLHLARGQMLNYRGPRGSGKTSHISKAYPLWAALEGVEPLTLLLAETGEQATAYLRAIKAELETNERLRAAYPHAAGVGPVWRDDRIVLRNGCAIVARGSAGRVLGLTHGSHRPTLVVGDDLNQRADAYSPTLRGRKWDWFVKDVMNVGGSGTNFLVAGTSIHREAITCQLTAQPGWVTRRFASVLRWPERMDLWHRWDQIYGEPGNPDAPANARAFYDAHSIEMRRGVRLLWRGRSSLYDLMCLRASIGERAFASEKQDEPGQDGSAEWPPEYFDRPDLWFHDSPKLVASACYLDPSKGKDSKAGDYQAHVWGGLAKDPATGLNCFWVEADLRRESPEDMMRRAVRNAAAVGSPLTCEDNGTMGFLGPAFQQACAAEKKQVALEAVTHTEAKLFRIRGLSGYLSRGQLRVRNTPGGRLLVDQLRDVPNGERDDGPDALSGFVRVIERKLNGR